MAVNPSAKDADNGLILKSNINNTKKISATKRLSDQGSDTEGIYFIQAKSPYIYAAVNKYIYLLKDNKGIIPILCTDVWNFCNLKQ